MLKLFIVHLIFYQQRLNWLFGHHRTLTSLLGTKLLISCTMLHMYTSKGNFFNASHFHMSSPHILMVIFSSISCECLQKFEELLSNPCLSTWATPQKLCQCILWGNLLHHLKFQHVQFLQRCQAPNPLSRFFKDLHPQIINSSTTLSLNTLEGPPPIPHILQMSKYMKIKSFW